MDQIQRKIQGRGLYAAIARGELSDGAGGGCGTGCVSSRVFSAIILWNPIPTPSMTANKIAHPIAPLRIALAPPLTARAPPVKNPAMIAFQGSSFFRIPFTAQSKVENNPPQTPKFPPSTGARALIAVRAPILRSPYGLFLNPLTPCQTVPPIAPIAKAPPKSLNTTHGQGSREWSMMKYCRLDDRQTREQGRTLFVCSFRRDGMY